MKKLLFLIAIGVSFTIMGCEVEYCHYMNEKKQRVNVYKDPGGYCQEKIFLNGDHYHRLMSHSVEK